MSYQKTWSGDWHSRILERVRQRGFDTLTAFANKRVGVSLVALAEELGAEDIAGAQIQSVLVDEATGNSTIPRLLRDLFVRELRDRVPQGWGNPPDDDFRSEVAGAYAAWWSELKGYLNHESSTAAARDFLNAELPPGWLPDGPDDPVIVAFVNRCLGHAPS
jgi:hypothetical protein